MNLGLHYFIMNNYWQKRIFDKPRQIIDQFCRKEANVCQENICPRFHE